MNGAEVVSSWLSPIILFCILNLMIAAIFIASVLNPSNRNQPKPGDADPQQLFRVPSLLDRVKSINLSRYRSEPQPDPVSQLPEAHIVEREPEPDSEETIHVARTKSNTGEKTMEVPAAARVLKKSASEKVSRAPAAVDRRQPETVRDRVPAEDEAVDAKADDFINRFRQQLKLQRLDSILRYKEMLKRGTGR